MWKTLEILSTNLSQHFAWKAEMTAFLFYHQVGGVCEKEMLIFCMVFQKKKKLQILLQGHGYQQGALCLSGHWLLSANVFGC